MTLIFPLVWIGMASTASAGVFPYEVHTDTLDNGLTVLVVPMPAPGVVAYQTWMAVGSRDEIEPGRTGFAHFFEHLMFYGTETLGGEDRENEILRLGADENAWTWFDDTVYHQVIATSELPRLVEIEADRFQNLQLTPDDIERESGAVYGEFRKGRASPGNRMWEELYATAFTTHTYAHDTIGYEADIAAMPTAYDHAMGFFDKYYRPEHAVIVVAGDVQPDQTFELIRGAYSDWKPATVPPNVIPVEPEQTEPRQAYVPWPTPTATQLGLAWPIAAADPDNADLAALQLAAQMLGAKTGPLYTRLIKDEGLAYDLYVGRDDLVDPGLFKVIVEIKEPEHLDAVRAAVLDAIASMSESVDPTTLERTRSHSRYGFLTGLDDPKTVAEELGWSHRRGGGPDAIDRFYASYDAVQPADVSQAVATWLTDARRTEVVLKTDPEAAAAAEAAKKAPPEPSEPPTEAPPEDAGGEP